MLSSVPLPNGQAFWRSCIFRFYKSTFAVAIGPPSDYVICARLLLRHLRKRSNKEYCTLQSVELFYFDSWELFTPFFPNRNKSNNFFVMIWSTLKLLFLVLNVSLCFCEFDCFNYKCDEKNEIQSLLCLMWDIWTLSCSKNQLNSFAFASSTCSQIWLSHRLHKVLLTGNGMMTMIQGTGLPCRVVRLAGGVRSPPGVGGANEPSWATT